MFRCQISGELSEPREKPVRLIVTERPVTYHLPGGETSHGREIVSEMVARLRHVDSERAARLALRKTPDIDLYRSLAEGRYAHARKCKKPLDDCSLCQSNLKWFDSLPAQILSRLSEERRAR